MNAIDVDVQSVTLDNGALVLTIVARLDFGALVKFVTEHIFAQKRQAGFNTTVGGGGSNPVVK